uniref:Ig-like domain-containing protein n=2 Tax=Equus caballus TaxID=9796 RepID=A0A9L0RW95_HORSE
MVCPGLLWVFVVSTCLGSSMAQTVTQPQPEMSVHEAETATLNCVYDTSDSDYYLFWYKQPPSGEMILIIRQEAYKQQNATNNRFSVNFQKADKSFSLRISDSQLEDAAMYFCAFMRAHAPPRLSVRTQSCSLGPRPRCCGTTVGGLVHRLCLSSCKEILK